MSWFQTLELKRKLILGFSAPLVLFIIIASVVYVSVEKLLETNKWVSHTYQAIELGNKITASLINMETGLRGYLVAGKEEFLEPYHAGKDTFEKTITEAKAKVSDNPAQVSRLKDVAKIKDTWLKEHVEVAIQYRTEVSQAAAKSNTTARREMTKENRTIEDVIRFIELGIGKQHMDNMREILDAFIKEEKKLIVERNNEQQNTADATVFITISGAILALVIGSLITLYLTRNVLRQLGADPQSLHQVCRKIAQGDLSTTLDTENCTGVMGSMMDMQQKISDIIENDLQKVLQAAQQGDLSLRIDSSEHKGFYLDLSKNINSLMETNQQVVDDTARIFSALSQGDLSQRIDNTYQGAFAELQNDANLTIENLREAIEGDIQRMVNDAREGNLSQRINTDNKSGFFKTLSAGINELVDINETLLNDLSFVMESMAQGNLSNKIQTQYSGAFAKLQSNTNSTITTLTEVIDKIKTAASDVKTGSSNIIESNRLLSTRAEDQASSLEETAASVEELFQVVALNVESVSEANKLSLDAQQTAQQGGIIVDAAIGAMTSIDQASNKILDIIGVIDEIAFQTNLLALNAAVEAARAGEQGRGFAVVAGEIRNLALRSATAAKEIKLLIKNSVDKVEEGTELVNKSGVALEKIVSSVERVCSVMNQLAISAEEQRNGIEQINSAITQIDSITRANAILAENTFIASDDMSHQATEMLSAIGFFSATPLPLKIDRV